MEWTSTPKHEWGRVGVQQWGECAKTMPVLARSDVKPHPVSQISESEIHGRRKLMARSDKAEAQYVCNACGKTYSSLDKLINHRKVCKFLKKSPSCNGRLMPSAARSWRRVGEVENPCNTQCIALPS